MIPTRCHPLYSVYVLLAEMRVLMYMKFLEELGNEPNQRQAVRESGPITALIPIFLARHSPSFKQNLFLVIGEKSW